MSAIAAACFHCKPARNAPTTSKGTSTSAVPRSGCLRIKPRGNPNDEPCFDQILERELIRAHLCKEARHHDDYNQFDQFRHLKKFAEDGNPALGAEAGVAEGEDGDEGGDANEIEDGSLVKDQVIVEAGEGEHQDEADNQPAELLVLHAGKGAAVRGGIDLDNAEGADGGEDG